MLKEERLYLESYGEIPDDLEGRLKCIEGKKYQNEKFDKLVNKEIKRIKRIKWIPYSFTMWKNPTPAHRPRVNNTMGFPLIYVPKAKSEANWFIEYLKEHPELPIIETPCTIDIDVYIKTPSSFSMIKKVLSELGYIRPWNKSDWDNYAKTVCDQIQHGMLKNDSLIIEGRLSKYYSIKPRIVVSGKYLVKEIV